MMRDALARLHARLEAIPAFELALRLLLLSLLLSPAVRGGDWRLSLPMQAAAFLALALPSWQKSRVVWGILAAFLAMKSVQNWWTQDNHHFLVAYSFAAVFLSLFTKDPAKTFALGARLLVGATFVFAVLWKAVLSSEFASGEYFEYIFLTDGRFADLTRFIGGLGDGALDYNRKLIRRLGAPSHPDSVELFNAPMVAAVAFASTYWVLAIESAVAALFLAPARFRLSAFRHIALLVFVWTTYVVASVETFGMTLLALGIAQCEPRQRVFRLLYLASFPLLMLYSETSILSNFPPVVPPFEPEIIE